MIAHMLFGYLTVQTICALYVGVGFLGTPQEWLWEALLFGATRFLCVCLRVA